MADTVATQSVTQARAEQLAKLPRVLVGGTAAMRNAGERYLPKFEKESRKRYDARLNSSTLFNAFGKTVADFTGRVFRKPIMLRDNVPAQIKTWAEDIDLTGRHLNTFARAVFFDALQAGIAFIFVDAPKAVTRDDGGPVTVADEKAAGNRPYMVHIPVENLLAWKSEMIAGVETLTQIRVKECVTEPDGEWGEKAVDQVRVIERDKWRVFRKKGGGSGTGVEEWIEVDTGPNRLGKITLAPVYTNRTGFMTGAPPLQELADLNVAHWQSQSDQRNILHVARVPILFGAGLPADNSEPLEIDASSMIRVSNPDATLQYVEHTGSAIGAGDKDLTNLEFQMQAMGLQLLTYSPGQTATGEMRDDSKEKSALAMMAAALGDGLEQALGFMAEYAGLGADAGGELEINTDLGVIGSADIANLLAAVNAGKISKVTFWAELKRRNVLSDSFDPDAERARLDHEDEMFRQPAMELDE